MDKRELQCQSGRCICHGRQRGSLTSLINFVAFCHFHLKIGTTGPMPTLFYRHVTKKKDVKITKVKKLAERKNTETTVNYVSSSSFSHTSKMASHRL